MECGLFLPFRASLHAIMPRENKRLPGAGWFFKLVGTADESGLEAEERFIERN
jgi:hypothetical protein